MDEIEKYVSNQKGLNDKQRAILKEKSDQTWFRQYAKKSKDQLIKITKTVKKQIKQNKGGYFKDSRNPQDDKRGFILPKKKGVDKKEVKNMYSKVKKPISRKNEKERKYTETTKKRVDSARKKYPNASNYELRHGVNSKASQEYRIRHGI